MNPTPTNHRFFEWDGSESFAIDLNDVLDQLTDDMSEYGDLSSALRRMLSRGLRHTNDGQRRGLNSMLRSLRDKQNENLRRYDMSGVMRDIEQQLKEILELEHAGINRMQEPAEGKEGDATQNTFKAIADQKEQELQDMPTSPAGLMKALQNYEFIDHEAQRKFLKLMEQLKNSIANSMFKNLSDAINNMSPEDLERLKHMAKALNEMLIRKIQGEDPGFEEFMEQFGDMFGDTPPESLDELLEQMQQQMQAAQSLLWSMSKSQRDELASMLGSAFDDPELQSELNKLRKELEYLTPPPKSFGFRGSEELDLDTARQLMEEMHRIERLKEQMLSAEREGDLEQIDKDLLREILDEESEQELDDLQRISDMLKEAGVIRQSDSGEWEITPQGARQLGFRALSEIYARLKKSRLGGHSLPEEGRFGDKQPDTKSYEFGDPLHLDLTKTLRNAVSRDGPHTPIKLEPDDFEIHRSELQTSTATALCLDLSTSMAMRGAFQPAKKVALALQHLITSQYPQDSFYVIGFDVMAKEVKPHALVGLQWDEFMTGTNMEHALLLSEKLLSKHQAGTKQIILISDGEPTVHSVNGRFQFNYPPTRATLQATYRAVKHCTKRDIAINTFMLDADGYFASFIDEVTKINGGRVFYTNPRRLGEYILVDYLKGKRQTIH